MIKNYFKTAWRNLMKSKMYSLINIMGLATGMAVALLISIWIWDELSYNTYHDNHARLAQVMTTQTFNGEINTGLAVSPPLGAELQSKYREDFKYVSMASWNLEHILTVGDKKIINHGMWVERDFPAMLSLKMISGSRDALKDPSSILLTQSLAKALFGDANPLNKIVKLDNVDNKVDLTVAGVYEDLPRNTTFYDTKFFASWEKYVNTESWLKESQTRWDIPSVQLFVQMNDHVDFAKTTEKIKYIPRQHMKEGKEEIILQPMDNWRLYSEFKNGKLAGGRIQFVWLFGIIGVFVLLLACINFMNLSTARSEKRAREVGVRKAVGSLRQQLVHQFLGESLVVSLIAFILSIYLTQLALPFFNSLSNKEMYLPWTNIIFWSLALLFTIFTGLISGSYPAFYLSGLNVVKVLKGTFRAGRSASVPRKVLVVMQFTISVILIIGTVIVFKQIQYAKNRPVGYTREGLITVMINAPNLADHYDVIRNDLLKTGVVENMAESSSPSTEIWWKMTGFDWKGKDPDQTPLFGIVAVTHDFGKTINWNIKEGRDFSRSFGTDTAALIVNEAAVKLIGIKAPVGETIKWNDKKNFHDFHVIGVVKDMVMESPYEPVKPTIFFIDYNWANVITIRIKANTSVKDAIAGIERVCKKYNPGSPFEYKFTDERYAQKFENEELIGNLATFFACLAIFISCLGLFGLASFVAEQRTKEIGVRKVLGASVFSLWKMLSKDFVTLVIISCLIAVPIAWYGLHQWLQRYAYRTEISLWIFMAAAAGALMITLLTVSFQAIKGAVANPVKSLRTE
jgi:ABC-type antimicrobial peptide transport system permease subunit